MASSAEHSTSLLQMPNEILLLIFHQTSTVGDACRLAQSCSHLYKLFNDRRNKVDILRSAAGVPWNPDSNLESVYSNLVIRVPPDWLIQSARPGTYIRISTDYGLVSEELNEAVMWDFTTIHSCGLYPRFRDALDKFLSQFEHINQRWKSHYESCTEAILSAAARLQIDILHDSDTYMDFSSETTVLALALHCLVIVRILTIIDIEATAFVMHQVFGRFSPLICSELGYKDDMFHLSITARRHEGAKIPDENQPPGYQHDDNLGAMLDHIVHLAFRLLDTRDPRHWPTVQYILLILYMVLRRLRPWAPWTETFKDTFEDLLLILRNLARYYYVCTDGGQILTTCWNEEDYTTRVGDCRRAVEHAHFLNHLWVEINGGIGTDSSTEERGIEDFPSEVDDFANCCDF